MERSFIDLQNVLITPPVLELPNFDMPLVVETDGSAFLCWVYSDTKEVGWDVSSDPV